MKKDAVLSSCTLYRYSLSRAWSDGPKVLFVMLNPSTADAEDDDATIGKCIRLARSWGYGALTVGNLFAFRTPSPSVLMKAENPVGEENDEWLRKLSMDCDLTVAAWGNHGRFRGRGSEVAKLLNNPHALKITKLGQPSHPLYLSQDVKPIPWAAS